MAEEGVNDARNEVRVEANRALGASEQKNKELADKLTAVDRARLSVEAGLKNTEIQAKDQHKQLHMTEIELATQRQLVLDLKAELQKVKDAVRVAKEATEAAEMASYDRGVLDTKTQLAEEVAEVCRDYYAEVWPEVLNRVGVPTSSELRSTENIFFPKDIREIPVMLPSPTVLPPPLLEQLPTIQTPSPDAEVLTVASKSKEDVKGGPQPQDKGKDKEVQPLTKANRSEDAFTIRDVVSKAKDAKSKSKARDVKSKGN